MKLLSGYPLKCLLLVLLSIVGYGVAAGGLEVLIGAVLVCVLSWFVTEGPRGRTLPHRFANLLVIGVSILALLELLQGGRTYVEVLGRFALGLTLIKLFERRTARDHAQLMSLSLMLILVGCLRTTSLLFGVLLLLYCVLGLHVLLVHQLYAAHERVSGARRAAAKSDAEATGPVRPTIGRRVESHARMLSVGMAVVGLALSSAVFVIFPRASARGEGDNAAAQRSHTDYVSEINLLSGSRITTSQRPVCRVELTDETGRSVRLPQPLYLRGAVLRSYHNGAWSGSDMQTRGARIVADDAFSLGLAPPAGRPVLTQEIEFNRPVTTIFSMYMPVAVETDEGAAVQFDPGDQTISIVAPEGGLWSYRVMALEDPSDAEVEGVHQVHSWADVGAEDFVTGVVNLSLLDHERVRMLAEEILRGAGLNPSAFRGSSAWSFNLRAARALAEYLRSAPFAYTLDRSDVVLSGEDPIVEFLFESRKGHCEFFASALVALCGSVGVDAHVVAGYATTDFDEDDRSYQVRELHAHAWVEVRAGVHRCVLFDPTPPGSIQSGAAEAATFTDRLGWFYEYLDGWWSSEFISFDNRAQSHLIDTAYPDWTQRVSEWWETLKHWIAELNRSLNFGSAGYIWVGVIIVAMAGSATAFGLFLRRYRVLRRALQWRGAKPGQVIGLMQRLGFYADMLEAFRRCGWAKPDWQPPLAFAAALEQEHPEIAGLVRRISDAYYECRFGGGRLPASERSEIASALDELTRKLKELPR
jgi:hypothetical protein